MALTYGFGACVGGTASSGTPVGYSRESANERSVSLPEFNVILYSGSWKAETWPSSNPKPKKEGMATKTILQLCSSFLQSTGMSHVSYLKPRTKWRLHVLNCTCLAGCVFFILQKLHECQQVFEVDTTNKDMLAKH